MLRFPLVLSLLALTLAPVVPALAQGAEPFCMAHGYSTSDTIFTDCVNGYNNGMHNACPPPAGSSAVYIVGYDGGEAATGTTQGPCTGGGTGTTGGGNTGGTGTGGSGTGGSGGGSTGGGNTGGTGTTGGGNTGGATGPCTHTTSLYGGPSPCQYLAASTGYHAASGPIFAVLLVLLLGVLGVWQGPAIVKRLVKQFSDAQDRGTAGASSAVDLDKAETDHYGQTNAAWEASGHAFD